MPIYAYRCEVCGFAKDVLQKMSDAQLTECPSCGKSSFKKQVTAAAFQLKGSGWYATDFRGGSGGANNSASAGEETSTAATSPGTSVATTVTTTPAPTAPTPAAPSSVSGGGKASASAEK
ncbi:MAG: zinc ribbon domain-containing protein [Glaciimonas sp.]|nr:zinc ribbon domain-containing protein [Glaciimonas sp.]